ncbi:DUF4214 domain-containing protein [Candidatus Arthromitus sp. SFB-rat-Yit]|uniref:DUF4214 domain-containing protein n=1 Tax=Candidatus Arthromitus sp. SFB-rat-Yit TaxID=1041504 RepID=UPI000227A4E9|nr:DUF4214 domain-containing protein [Candidatus Arthromitus sp. SFB-rat-Yit]BAK80980.1 hypothetical protein RATSFB_0418 [Candidatus Arthromitus sp. SFB-rat-Yit]
MKTCMKKFIINLMILIFLFELIPLGDMGIKLGFVEKSSAYYTQLDSVAPGYVISAEEGGIVFDLSQRLSSSMSVESFSIKNMNPEQQKKDLKEESSDGVRWLTKDEMINGHIYEIESKIYDSEIDKTLTFINSFKFTDKNTAYNPKVSFSNFDANRMITQDVFFDFSNCKELINNSNRLDLEILNSDLTKAEIDSVFVDKNDLVNAGYRYKLSRAASIFKPNKDYIIRLNADGVIWDKMISCSLKANPTLVENIRPTEIDFKYYAKQRNLFIPTLDFGICKTFTDRHHVEVKIILSNSKKGLVPVEVTGEIPRLAEINIPEEYCSTIIPSDIRVYFSDKYTGALLAEYLFQVTFKEGGCFMWTGLSYYGEKDISGYQITKITPVHEENDTTTVPHSWDEFPRAHYITLYDNKLENQIGGEYRFDVTKTKYEYVGAEQNVKGANFKVPFKDMRQGFNSYNFKFESSNRYPEWGYAYIPFGFYADIVEIKDLDIEVKDLKVNSSGKYDFSFELKNQNVITGDKMSIIDDNGKEYIANVNTSKRFNFKDIPLVFGGKYVVTYNKISSLFHFKSTDMSILFNPVVIGTSSNGQNVVEIDFDKKYEKILNSDRMKNRIRILHMNGNSTGNEFTDFNVGKHKFTLSSGLTEGQNYIVEFSNSKEETYKTTFQYTTMKLDLSDVTGTTAKLNWEYPSNYLITDGDVLNIYFKKEDANYPAIPDAKIMHGFQGIDFNDVTTYTIRNMSPNINYVAKLELVTNEGMTYVDETEFVTSTFKILNEEIEGISEDGTVNSKSINFKWDINLGDIEFNAGDKVELFLKLRSHNAFPKTPVSTIDQDLNRNKRIKFDVSNYYEDYSAKIVYTIGGVRHTSKVLNFSVEPEKLELSVNDITDYSAVVNWKYPEGINIENNHEIRVYLRKAGDLDYRLEKTYKQSETSLKDVTKYKFDKLRFETTYQVKLVYKVGDKQVAGVSEDVTQDIEIEFRTESFVINNLRFEKDMNNLVNVMWNLKNDNYPYVNGDSVELFLKERGAPSQNYKKFQYATGNISAVRAFNIMIPKFNVDYDMKLTYTLGGKQVSAYGNCRLDMGDIGFNVDEITDTKIKVSWTYPDNYSISNNDKIEVSLKNLEDGNNVESESKTQNYDNNNTTMIKDFKEKEFTLTKDKMYEVKIRFSSVYAEPIEKSFKFKATSGFQILGLVGKSLDSKSFKLEWDFYNNNEEFDSNSKIEILYKEEPKGSSQDASQDNNVEDKLFENVNPVSTRTGSELKEFKSYVVEGLDVNKNYLFRVRYTITGDSGKVVYKDLVGKTEARKITSSVIDTQPTGVKISVEYPENYEILEGDILDIFIRRKEETNYSVNPNFTGKHGSGEDDVDLNEVTVLDILGLSPNKEYFSKVVFWPDGGSGIKQEMELSFKTDVVEGIGEVIIGDVLDYVVKVGIKMEPDELILSDKDSCKVFIKKKDQTHYPDKSNGEIRGDIFNEEKFISAYFDELNAEYDVKVIVNIGGNEFEKETSFVSKIDDFNIDVKEINPMTTQVEWRYPNNYTLVDGESIQIFIKYQDEDDFLSEPDLELIQSDDLNLSDINLVELYSLIPDTRYEVKVKLNLLEADVKPVIKEFTTTVFEIENLEIQDISSDGMSIKWDLSTEELDFIDEYDNLSVFIKNSNEEDYDFSNPVAEFTEGLNDIRSISFQTEDSIADVDIYLSYLIEDYEAAMEISYTAIDLNVEVQQEGVLVEWTYPPGIEFEKDDRLDIYLKHANKSGYKTEPNFRYTNGKDGDLSELNEIFFKRLGIGNYVMKFSLITSDMRYNPIEIEFNVQDQDVVGTELKFNGKSSNRKIELDIVGDNEFDYEKGFNINPEGLDLEIDEVRNKFIVKNLVPGKDYKNIVITFYTEEDDEINFVVKNVKINPENLLQEFITNIYKFAFERYPDEEGYGYWLGRLLEKGEVTGKFVLYNLMFAEREFSERNLSDDELIKVLYQIVVNREYDEGGLNYWIGEYRNTYLPQANNDSYEAQKAIVARMLHEQEFKDLCNKMGILW